MFLHETLSHHARVAITAAWGLGLVASTALLMAALDGALEQQRWEPGTPTHAEVVMQGAQDKALASPAIALVAAMN